MNLKLDIWYFLIYLQGTSIRRQRRDLFGLRI